MEHYLPKGKYVLIVDVLRRLTTVRQRYRIKAFLPSLLYRNDLRRLARYFKTDKEGAHFYMQHYQRHFAPLRRLPVRILEIGVGGTADLRAGGESLRTWKAYFRKAQIFGIDIYDKSYNDEPRIKTFIGSQVDEEFLARINREHGPFDIIIDDGSHYVEHVRATFQILFPLLAPGGIYVVEDTQTSYWPEAIGHAFGGSADLAASHTSMNWFKALIDGLNYEEFIQEDYVPSYFDRHIVGMHFYHNLVFVQKGDNREGSNFNPKRR